MKLRDHSARAAAIRVRGIRAAYVDFEGTMTRLERLERLGQRLRSATIVDLVIRVKTAVIDACCPRPRLDVLHCDRPDQGGRPEDTKKPPA